MLSRAANFLFYQEPGAQTSLVQASMTTMKGRKKKKGGAVREALGSLTELKNYARGLGNCANVGSSLGGTGPPEKTLWACYRGRKTGTGTGQAEEEKPPGQSGFSPPHTRPPPCWSHIEKLHYCSLGFKSHPQEKRPNAHRPGPKLTTCFHKTDRDYKSPERQPTVADAAGAPRRGLLRPTALSPSGESVHGLSQEPWPAALARRFRTFAPFTGICKIIKKPTFKSYNL